MSEYIIVDGQLYHHGIKGQKWGVRRFQNKDGSYTPAGKKRRAENENVEEQTPEKKKLSNKQKAIIAGTVVVAAYATYKFVDSGRATQLIAKGKEVIGKSDSGFKKNVDLAKKNMSADEIFDTVIRDRINPGYGDIGTKNNCRRCTFAYEMSRRGYDVKATKSIKGTGQSALGLSKAKNVSVTDAYKKYVNDYDKHAVDRLLNTLMGKKINIPDFDIDASDSVRTSLRMHGESVSEKLFDTIRQQPDGSRGEISMMWRLGGAHSMAYEIVKGEPVIFDCQDGTKYNYKTFAKIAENIKTLNYSRLDNIELNEDFLKRWLQNA